MDALIVFAAVTIAIILFDLLAVALGADSRDDFTDEHPYPLTA